MKEQVSNQACQARELSPTERILENLAEEVATSEELAEKLRVILSVVSCTPPEPTKPTITGARPSVSDTPRARVVEDLLWRLRDTNEALLRIIENISI